MTYVPLKTITVFSILDKCNVAQTPPLYQQNILVWNIEYSLLTSPLSDYFMR